LSTFRFTATLDWPFYSRERRVGDPMMYPQTMHRARRFDDRNEVRDVRRTTLAGDVAMIEQIR
jgi:hypothetical protein